MAETEKVLGSRRKVFINRAMVVSYEPLEVVRVWDLSNDHVHDNLSRDTPRPVGQVVLTRCRPTKVVRLSVVRRRTFLCDWALYIYIYSQRCGLSTTCNIEQVLITCYLTARADSTPPPLPLCLTSGYGDDVRLKQEFNYPQWKVLGWRNGGRL